MHTYMNTEIYTQYTQIYTHMNIDMHTLAHILNDTHANRHTHAHKSTHINTQTHVHMHTNTYTYMQMHITHKCLKIK